MIRIAVTGPESTGKTTLARQLARRYDAPWTPEYARYYLRRLNRPYLQDDLLAIARGQLEWEEAKGRRNPDILFSDTCLLVIKIWSEFKYGNCHPWILEQLRAHTYDLYLLCGTDLPWVYDPLRENPGEREELYAIYKKELLLLDRPFVEIAGPPEERFRQAVKAVDDLLMGD
jgi:NadR type nicotinamide-nucleotide adenylyltransferase